MPLRDILLVMYKWAEQPSSTVNLTLTGVASDKTIRRLCKFLRDSTVVVMVRESLLLLLSLSAIFSTQYLKPEILFYI